MTGGDEKKESGRTGGLGDAVAAFAARVRAAAAETGDLRAEMREHPLETVTGAFGLGYLLGKALFGRKR